MHGCESSDVRVVRSQFSLDTMVVVVYVFIVAFFNETHIHCSAQSKIMSDTTPGFAALAEMDWQSELLVTQQLICSCNENQQKMKQSPCMTACKHRGCRACIVSWIGKQEASGQVSSLTCPFCCMSIQYDKVIAILGR